MKQQLRKPENWQDFEELCCILWGEIWQCPETNKNGRSGQNQLGVDIYGTPKGEVAYYGVQCKGKDEYTHAGITRKEIDNEVEKAKNFKPQLKKLYFATTANKDADIEEYVRIKDLECRSQGLFEVHLFCWEDIVALIDNHQRTHDWYVKKIDFRTNHAAKISFDNGNSKLVFAPPLIKAFVKYDQDYDEFSSTSLGRLHALTIIKNLKTGEKPKLGPFGYENKGLDLLHTEANTIIRRGQATEAQPYHYYMNGDIQNLSSCVFGFMVHNVGNKAIEELKINFQFEGNINLELMRKGTSMVDWTKYSYNVSVDGFEKLATLKPTSRTLVQKDYIISDKLCFRPNTLEKQIVLVNWQLISRDFNDEGQLIIEVSPIVEERNVLTSNPYELKGLTNGFRIDNDTKRA